MRDKQGVNPELVIREGRNRQVRRMTAAVGLPTLRLMRTAIGPVKLDDLQPGQWRELTPSEVRAFGRLVGPSSPRRSSPPRR